MPKIFILDKLLNFYPLSNHFILKLISEVNRFKRVDFILLWLDTAVYWIFFNKMLAAAKYLGAGFACSGLIGAGTGIGLVFSALIASIARNPQLRGQLFSYAILGFALVEATG